VERWVEHAEPVGSAALAAEDPVQGGTAVEDGFKHQRLADPATVPGMVFRRTICSTDCPEILAGRLQITSNFWFCLGRGMRNVAPDSSPRPPRPIKPGWQGARGTHPIALGLTGFSPSGLCTELLAGLAPPSRYNEPSDCGGFSAGS